MTVQNTFNKGAGNYYYYYYYYYYRHHHHHICALWQHSVEWHVFLKKITELVRTQKTAVLIYFAEA
jgi:hypothetical protein